MRRLVIRAVEHSEGRFAPLPHSVYRLVLDYFYWVGALDMLRENRGRRRIATALPLGS
jgi:hypothetical protein